MENEEIQESLEADSSRLSNAQGVSRITASSNEETAVADVGLRSRYYPLNYGDRSDQQKKLVLSAINEGVKIGIGEDSVEH